MIRYSFLGAAATVGLLAGCASDIEQVRDVRPTGTDFTQSLAREYRDFALFERDQMYDWGDSRYFARKGLAASEGETVLPETPEDWDQPESAMPDLQAGRTQLVSLLEGGARQSAPELAARAQARYDCWVEQQEENHQPAHIAACREEFLAIMDQLQTATAPAEQPAAIEPAAGPTQYRVFFEFDRYSLEDAAEGREIVQRVVADARQTGAEGVSLIGHADRAGPDKYNFGLSLQRADSIRQALIDGGIPADQITVSGRGEETPLVPTEDGQPLQENRRVEIILQ